MRFFSSVALPKAPKFMLAASCSAADAMRRSSRLTPAGRRLAGGAALQAAPLVGSR